MQSYVNHVQGLANAILNDLIIRFPLLRCEFERDKLRLSLLAEARGLPFFTIDLPEAGKHLDKCLAAEAFTPTSIAGLRRYKKGSTIPRLFKGLYLRVFNELGVLRSDADVAAIRALRQLYYFAKKLKVDCDASRTRQQVVEFYRIEREVRAPTYAWDSDELGQDPERFIHLVEANKDRAPDSLDLNDRDYEAHFHDYGRELVAIQEVCDIVSCQLGRFDPTQWKTKHGPGAVSDSRAEVSKYEFLHWPDKLERTFPMSEFAFANYGQWAEFVVDQDGYDERFSLHEPPSRLIAVPKTQKGPRLIAAEPTAHQWCQQSIRDYLTNRLGYTPLARSIHFRDQSFNQEGARRASQDGSKWTIDLSSASDRVSCWLVERAFRRNTSLLDALHAARTRWITQSIDKKSPKFHKLRKFCTQGSAVTFPVQSILFACIAIGTLLSSRNEQVSTQSIRTAALEVLVFGDDIIVPIDVGESLQGVLSLLGFKVNHNKTFGSGNFRESCGMDAWNGFDVTPVYSNSMPVRTRPESVISSVETHNNFYRKGYGSVATWIESAVHKAVRGNRIPYVPADSGNFGFVSRCWNPERPMKTRFNWALHRREILVDVPNGRTTRKRDRYSSMLLQFFTEAPLPTTKWVAGVTSRPRLNLRPRWEPLASFAR